MDVLLVRESLPSNEIKAAAGFGKSGERGFEGAMAALQMQTYITVRSFQRRSNKKQEEYGWPVAVYSISEDLFGEEHIRSAYSLGAVEAKERIVAHIKSKFADVAASDIVKVIR
jgi:hypothetical protein